MKILRLLLFPGWQRFLFPPSSSLFFDGATLSGTFGKSSKEHWHNYNRYFEVKWFISQHLELILTKFTLFTTRVPHLSKHSRHSIISLFFSLPLLLLFQLSLLPERQSIGKLISYIWFLLSKLPGRFIFKEWSLVFPVEGVDDEGCTLTISEDPKIIGLFVTSIRVGVIEI